MNHSELPLPIILIPLSHLKIQVLCIKTLQEIFVEKCQCAFKHWLVTELLAITVPSPQRIHRLKQYFSVIIFHFYKT